jgi:hypothetical protein
LEVHPILADVALEPVVAVADTTTLTKAAQLLARGYGTLLLLDPLRAVRKRDLLDAIADGAEPGTPLSALSLARPNVLSARLAADAALQSLLSAPEDCFVVDDGGELVGRATLDRVLRALLARPRWVHALQLALHIHQETQLEVDR